MNMKQKIFIVLCIITFDVSSVMFAIYSDSGLVLAAAASLILLQGVILIKHAVIKFYEWLGD